jgi:hypothetical protein
MKSFIIGFVLTMLSFSTFAECRQSSVKGIYQFTITEANLAMGAPYQSVSSLYVRRLNFDGKNEVAISRARGENGVMSGVEGSGEYIMMPNCILTAQLMLTSGATLSMWADMEDVGSKNISKEGEIEVTNRVNGIGTRGVLVRLDDQ